MKKFGKTLLCAAVVAALGTGVAFAKGRNGDFQGEGPEKGFGKGFGGRFEVTSDGTITPKADLIGQVTSVDEKSGTIKVADLDGKETIISVNPFTQIRVNDSKDEKTLADIKKGDWIMYSLYNTETEKKLASRIIVKAN